MLVQYYQKVKEFAIANKKDLFLVFTIILVSIISFGLGRISILLPQKEPVQIINGITAKTADTPTPTKDPVPIITHTQSQGKYVASKNGSYYYYPSCSGATRIKDENKIWFQTKEKAEKLGYKPAINCPGL